MPARIRNITTILLTLMISLSCERFEDTVEPDKEEVFIRFFGGFRTQTGTDVTQLADGGYLLFGSSNSFLNEEEQENLGEDAAQLYLVRTDPEGNELWSNIFFSNISDNFLSLDAVALQADENGFSLLATEEDISQNRRIAVIRVDQQGNEVGRFSIDDPGGTNLQANDFVIANDGTFWILGTRLINGENSVTVFRRDTDGNPVSFDFSDPFDVGELTDGIEQVGNRIIRTAFGSENFILLTTGPSSGSSSAGENRFNIVPISSTNGNATARLEIEQIDGISSGNIDGVDIVSTAGSFIMLGNASGTAVLAAVSSNAENVLWTRTVRAENGLNVSPASLAITNDGGLAITGSLIDQNSNIFLDRTNMMGETTDFPASEGWPRQFGGSGNDNGSSVLQTSDRGFAVVGSITLEGENSLMTLIKTNAQGELR